LISGFRYHFLNPWRRCAYREDRGRASFSKVPRPIYRGLGGSFSVQPTPRAQLFHNVSMRDIRRFFDLSAKVKIQDLNCPQLAEKVVGNRKSEPGTPLYSNQ